jgi:transposase
VVGFALGGESGFRLAVERGLTSSSDTLLRCIRSAPLPDSSEVRVLGVDDWALRRGGSGTILVDLEERRPIDLLEGSKASTFAEWSCALSSSSRVHQPRSRGSLRRRCSGGGSRGGADRSDRWHLLKNLSEHLENTLWNTLWTANARSSSVPQQMSAANR